MYGLRSLVGRDQVVWRTMVSLRFDLHGFVVYIVFSPLVCHLDSTHQILLD